MKTLWKFLAVSSGILIAASWMRLGYDFQPKKILLADFGKTPDFILTDSQAKEFTSQALRGKVWVTDFIFTTCAGICPTMSKNMSSLYQSFLSDKRVEFVSISVNPTNDSPQVLTEYAKRYKADPSKWHFLTGKIETIEAIMAKGFKIGSAESPAMHSGYFVLVDKKGQIRGYYDGMDKDRIRQLLLDIAALTKEKI